jgi:HEAT repeat protein
MSKSVDQLCSELRNPDVAVRRAAAQQFAESPEASHDGCLTLLDAIEDDDEQVREWVSAAFEGMEAPDASAVPTLMKYLASEQSGGSYWAATLLGRLGPQASPATEALVAALLDHGSLATRERAAWAIGKIGAAAKSAIPALQQMLQSGMPRLSRLAETAIQSIES